MEALALHMEVYFSSLGFLIDAGEVLRLIDQTLEIINSDDSLLQALNDDICLLWSKRLELENHPNSILVGNAPLDQPSYAVVGSAPLIYAESNVEVTGRVSSASAS
jgi:hypothetical protein